MEQNIERIENGKMAHLLNKGVPKAVPSIEGWHTTANSLINNNLGESVNWIGVKQAVPLTGIPKKTLCNWINSDKMSVRKTKMNGGWGYEIELNSLLNTLPAGKRAEVLAKFNSGSPQSAVGSPQSAVNSQQPAVNSLKLAADMTNKQREIMLARADFLALYSPLTDMSHGSALSAKKDFLAQFNTGIVYPLLYKILGDIVMHPQKQEKDLGKRVEKN